MTAEVPLDKVVFSASELRISELLGELWGGGGFTAEVVGSQWRHAEPIIVSLTLSN